MLRLHLLTECHKRALRKTGHLLSALSSTVQPDQGSAPITYHPLDLSFPELERVLGEMDETFGSQLKDKVDCIGLHGDYEAGLQFIREDKLASLRATSTQGTSPGSKLVELVLPDDKARDPSPASTNGSEGLMMTPGPDSASLMSELTATDESASASGGTWSPVESEILEPAPATHSTENEMPVRPLHFVFLGSSIGNFSRDSAGPFLKSLPLRQGDTILLGLDGRPEPGEQGKRKLESAYNDPSGYTKAFEEHAWDVVRKELDLKGDAGVEFVGRYNEGPGRYPYIQRWLCVH